MDKLTKRTPGGIAYLAKVLPNEQEIEASRNTCECLYESWQRLASYEDTNCTPEQVAEWARAEKEGRLVVLPCKVGDTVYWISQLGTGVRQGDVTAITINGYGFDLDISREVDRRSFKREFEKVFLTRAEAEAALEGREANHASSR